MTDRPMILRFAALRIEQRPDVPLYIFGVNGRLIHQFATVNFAERSVDGVLAGYQRTRVAAHIAQIRAYLAHDDALLPNAIVIAVQWRCDIYSGRRNNEQQVGYPRHAFGATARFS